MPSKADPDDNGILSEFLSEIHKDLFIKNRSKLSRVLLLCLLRFFMNKSLLNFLKKRLIFVGSVDNFQA